MNESWSLGFILTLAVLRPLWLWKLWNAPHKQGRGCFLSLEVPPEFYQTRGSALLRQYRLWIALPFLLESSIFAALALSGRYRLAIFEQVPAIVILVACAQFTTYQFIERVRRLSPAPRLHSVTSVQLSLKPRRLRDYLDWRMEALIGGLTLFSLFWLADQWIFHLSPPAYRAVKLYRLAGLLLYLQIGVLLLKQLYVRWRTKLPLNRVEDYERWRAAWLSYHIHTFYALRLFLAVCLADALFLQTLERWWTRDQMRPVELTLTLVALVIYSVYAIRERRRLQAVAREIRPHELIREYPPAPVVTAADGRYLAGGLLTIDRGNPWIVTRSPQGLAINLGSRGIYVFTGYLTGLVLVLFWGVAG